MVFASGVPVDAAAVDGGAVCMVSGCSRPVHARGLCRRHYDRNRLSGSPLRPLRQRLCPLCHEWFEPRRVDQVFCCANHRSLYFWRSEADPSRYPKGARPKLFELERDPLPPDEPDLVWESFTSGQVVERCRGVCQRCGTRVDLDAVDGDGPAYAWRVPLDECHRATLDNRILVHRRCRDGMS